MIKIMDPPTNDRVVSVENFHILFTSKLVNFIYHLGFYATQISLTLCDIFTA